MWRRHSGDDGPPDEGGPPDRVRPNASGKDRAQRPRVQRPERPPSPGEQVDPTREGVGTVAGLNAQSEARLASGAGWVSRPGDFSWLGHPDATLACLACLPFRVLMRMMCTCRHFAGLQQSEGMSDVARRCLCVSFPLMRYQSLPLASYADLRQLYHQFFFDMSAEVPLFSDRGRLLVRRWIMGGVDPGRSRNRNLPCSVEVLRRAGFFCSFYSRLRLVALLCSEMSAYTDIVRRLSANATLVGEYETCQLMYYVAAIIRCEYILQLVRHSFSVSLLSVHSGAWKTFAMHDPSLTRDNARLLLDVDEQDIARLNATFRQVLCNMDRDSLRQVFTRLDQFNPELSRIFLLIVQFGARFNGLGRTALFRTFYFNMTPGASPAAWHNSEYTGDVTRIIEDDRSDEDRNWRLCIEDRFGSANWGVMLPLTTPRESLQLYDVVDEAPPDVDNEAPPDVDNDAPPLPVEES